jgi:cellobiose-specific phosphotransferase system component IIA
MQLQRRLTIRTVAKLFGAALLLLLIGFSSGFLLARRQTVACEAMRARAETRAESATRALDEQKARYERLSKRRESSRTLTEARARLLQGLIEVHGKNFGLASQHVRAAREQIDQAHTSWPASAERERLAKFVQRLTQLHERTMLLDARVVEQLQQLAAELQAFVADEPS